MSSLVDGLNDAQREAVCHHAGPLLVLAGAGSGKTRVLTLRIAWMVQELGIRPWELLAVTFTNKAAGEMKERVEAALGAAARDCWVSTFHSSCLRILRRDIERIDGYGSDFVIYDDRDSKDLMKRIIKEAKLPSSVNPRSISSAIDRAKNDCLSPDQLEAQRRSDLPPRTAELYRTYQQRLRASNALDFGDLILLTIRLLEDNPDVLERYQQRFKNLLVDEYQDTNHSQYKLLRLLADHNDRSITVVGDEDQSIYSFRGADIRNILDFERDFPGAHVVRLERNYRSTQTILKAATAVVERNTERKGKVLWTEIGGGDLIHLQLAHDDREEARAAVELARRELGAGRKPRDIAVFFRTNAQSRLLEEEFLSSRLPFVLLGGQRFYERREVKDAMAYVKLLVNARDEVSLMRIINKPARGIGGKTLGDLANTSTRKGYSLWEALVDLSEDESYSSRARKALLGFKELIIGLRQAAYELPLPKVLDAVLQHSGMRAQFEADGSFEAQGRLANLDELLSATADYAHLPPPEGLLTFLDRVALVSDTDKLDRAPDEQERGRITLMTVHSAKGLEFPAVIVVGMDEGLFPHARSSTFQKELEEERRLAYVAITRAKERLYLLRARRRPAQGGMGYEATRPSRFLKDIPRELLTGASVQSLGPQRSTRGPEVPGDSWVEYDRPQRPRSTTTKRRSGGGQPWQSRFASKTGREVDHAGRDLGTSSRNEPRVVPDLEGAEAVLGVGTRVIHPTFGEGEVRTLEGPPDNLRATVFFRKGGNKRLYLRFANLEIVSR
jgi:DNA helicase-2/ATP-dependent DNA helicase PcrA